MKEHDEKMAELEIKELKEKAGITKNVRQKRRYDVIRLSLQGYSNNEISKILDISLRQVYNLINLYKENGIEGLKLKYSPGRKTKLTAEQEKELYDVITKKLPKDVGFEPFCNWTAPLACRYVKTVFNVEFSERGMRDVFYRLNLSYTRPTYVLAKADAQKQAEFTEKLEKIKKILNEEIDYLLFEDESMIRDYQAIQKTWFAKGNQRIIQTYGKHEGVKLVGFLNYETGEVYVEEHKTYNAEVFKIFYKMSLKKYPQGKIVMILDNAKIHHAKLLKEFLEKNPRLQLEFLPPYSPNLNIIEELWLWLKNTVINNVFFHSVEEIKDAVLAFIEYLNSVPYTVIDRLCI